MRGSRGSTFIKMRCVGRAVFIFENGFWLRIKKITLLFCRQFIRIMVMIFEIYNKAVLLDTVLEPNSGELSTVLPNIEYFIKKS